jgi:hypothetical protein
MKITTLLALLILLSSAGACRTSESATNPVDADIPCTCGTPDALFEGCASPLCASGHNHPGNPDCVCGTIVIGPTKGK